MINEYNDLGNLLYPSIESSGNLFYGQTRRLITDNTLGRNELNFDSHIESFNEDGQYTAYFNWKIGPFKDAIKVNIDSSKSVSTFPTVKYFDEIVNDGTLISHSVNTDFTLSGYTFAKYRINFITIDEDNIINSGKYKSYTKNASISFMGIVVVNSQSYTPYKKLLESDSLDNHQFLIDGDYLYIKLSTGTIYNSVDYNNEQIPLTLKAVDNSVRVKLVQTAVEDGTFPDPDASFEFKYSINASDYISAKSDWSNPTILDIVLNKNDTLSLVCNNRIKTDSPVEVYPQFEFESVNGKIEAYGNANSMFCKNFINAKLVRLRELFRDCTLLTKANIALPCISLAESAAYYSMFKNCTNLVEGPKLLPATVLTNNCYNSMFENCSSLKTTPVMPALVIDSFCCAYMFQNCSSLTKVTSLKFSFDNDINRASNDCTQMFFNCTQLSEADITIESIPSDYNGNDCFTRLFAGCTNLKGLYCSIPRDAPSGDFINFLPDTQGFIYHKESDYPMFIDLPASWNWKHIQCVKSNVPLTLRAVGGDVNVSIQYHTDGGFTFPVLQGVVNHSTEITIDENTVIHLNNGDIVSIWSFNGTQYNLSDYINFTFTSDNNGKIEAYGSIESINDVRSAEHYLFYRLFKDCDLLITAPECYVDTYSIGVGVYKETFKGCTNLQIGPSILEDTESQIGSDYYESMFEGCTALAKSPILKRTVLSDSCYKNLFKDCANLSEITCYATDTSANDCLSGWLDNAGTNNLINYLYVVNNNLEWNLPTKWKLPVEFISSVTQSKANNHAHLKCSSVISSGSDSNNNGRGKLNESTKFSMLQYNPFNTSNVDIDSYNANGSFNQEIWGYKQFNSPISFKNGIYGEYSILTTLSLESSSLYTGSKLCYNSTTNDSEEQTSSILLYNDDNNAASLSLVACNKEKIANHTDDALVSKGVSDNYSRLTLTSETESNITLVAKTINLKTNTIQKNGVEWNPGGYSGGDITGNITGNVIGNINGNVQGKVIGSVGGVDGNVLGNVLGNINGCTPTPTKHTNSTTFNDEFPIGSIIALKADVGAVIRGEIYVYGHFSHKEGSYWKPSDNDTSINVYRDFKLCDLSGNLDSTSMFGNSYFIPPLVGGSNDSKVRIKVITSSQNGVFLVMRINDSN